MASSSSTALFLLALLLPSLFLLLWRKHRRRSRKLPPGNQGFPIIGETLRLISAYKTSNPEPFIDIRISLYGKIFTTHVFGERTVFSADPDFNRFLLRSTSDQKDPFFRCSYPSSISTLLGKHSLLLLHGARHKKLHSLTLARFAAPAKLRTALFPHVDRVVRETLGSWLENLEFKLLEEAKRIGFGLAVMQLIGREPGDWSEKLRKEYLVLIDGFFSMPVPKFLAKFSTYGRAIRARMKVADALMDVVRARKEERQKRGERNDGIAEIMEKDMLEDLLDSEDPLADEELVDFMLALLVAGYETTSTIMTLAVMFLTENPCALSCIKKEHEEIREKKQHEQEPLDWNDYKSMAFTQCVINETLRMGNIISGVFRRTVKDIDFKGYTIPKGCKVFASFRGVHMDPEYYNDARTFNPWRWQDKESNTPQSGPNGASTFTPFGGGQRLCPGYELARVEIAIFLHYLLTWFTWELAEEDRLVFFPTTRTLKGYPIKVRRRRQSQQ